LKNISHCNFCHLAGLAGIAAERGDDPKYSTEEREIPISRSLFFFLEEIQARGVAEVGRGIMINITNASQR
jgi:hypothetical protein